MSDKPEPLAAILAEMRDFADHRAADAGGERPAIELLRSFADRIEAAVERERNAHTNDIHNALYMATGIPGNAAALREALERIVCWCEGCHADACEKVCRPELTSESIHAALAALAAPARNCDRFATAEEARRAFESAHSHGIVHNLYTAAFDWLFVTAEGGDHA